MPTTMTAYTYNELSPEAKKAALEKMRYVTTEHFEWWDYVYEDWIERLAEMGYETDADHIWFSGFWSQGDGASFTASVDVLKWLEYTDVKGADLRVAGQDYRSLRYWLRRLDPPYVRITQSDSHYYHRFTMSIEYVWDNWTEPPKALCQFRELRGAILDHAREQALLLYRELEDVCEDMMSDEYVSDFLIANEYLFWESGRPV